MKYQITTPLVLVISLLLTISGCSSTTANTAPSPSSSLVSLSAEERASIIQNNGDLKEVYAEDQLTGISQDHKNGKLLPIMDRGWHEINLINESAKLSDTPIPFRLKSVECDLDSIPVKLRSNDSSLANVDVPAPIKAEIQGNHASDHFDNDADIRLCLVQYDIANSTSGKVSRSAKLSLQAVSNSGVDHTAVTLTDSLRNFRESEFKFVNEVETHRDLFIVPAAVDDPYVEASGDVTEGWFPADGSKHIYQGKTMYREWQLFAYDANTQAPAWISQNLTGITNGDNPAPLAEDRSGPDMSALHDMTDPKTVYDTMTAKDYSPSPEKTTQTVDNQWIEWASSIVNSADKLPRELDELGCDSPGDSWSVECLAKLNGMYKAMDSAVAGVTGGYETFGTPETAAIDEAAKMAQSASSYSVGIVMNGVDAGCLSQNSPQREIPRDKDGQLVSCYMFFTTMYGHQYAENIQAIAHAGN